eukprot:2471143-Lingulodinium_polyedra.AAC.1
MFGTGITSVSTIGVQKIIRKAHARIDVEFKLLHSPADRVRFAAFHDAGWVSRPGGSAQGGHMIMASDSALLVGQYTSFHDRLESRKFKR